MQASAGETVEILTNQTPFYAESGGQAGDTGTMTSRQGARARSPTPRRSWARCTSMSCKSPKARFALGDAVDLKVDRERRRATRANHSATHLLHAALKRVLGNHVSQKGSLVEAERLRFDFSHPKPVTAEELERIEAQVNASHPPEFRHHHAPDAHRPGHRRRRRSPVRRKIWRRSARALHGRRSGRRQDLFRRTVRRHPCAPPGRYRAFHHPGRKAPWPPACAASRR